MNPNTHPLDHDRLIDAIIDRPDSPAAADARAALDELPGGRGLLAMHELLREPPEVAAAPDVAPAVMARLTADSHSVFRSIPTMLAAAPAVPPEPPRRAGWWSRLAPTLLPLGLAAAAVALLLLAGPLGDGAGSTGGGLTGTAVGGDGSWLAAGLLALAAALLWLGWSRRR
jgi:hypothetical protein